jgi:hypothetical protein
MDYLFFIFCIGCEVALLMLVVRLVLYPFSAKVRAEVKRQPVVHWVWVFLAVLGAMMIFFANRMASQAMKRHKQIQLQQERSHPPTTNAPITTGS